MADDSDNSENALTTVELEAHKNYIVKMTLLVQEGSPTKMKMQELAPSHISMNIFCQLKEQFALGCWNYSLHILNQSELLETSTSLA